MFGDKALPEGASGQGLTRGEVRLYRKGSKGRALPEAVWGSGFTGTG